MVPSDEGPPAQQGIDLSGGLISKSDPRYAEYGQHNCSVTLRTANAGTEWRGQTWGSPVVATDLERVVEDLAHEDELLGRALEAGLDLLELIHHRHHKLHGWQRSWRLTVSMALLMQYQNDYVGTCTPTRMSG